MQERYGLVKNDEDLEDLQRDNLFIIQKKSGFRFGIDAVLLSKFIELKLGEDMIDLCTGTGIIPLLSYDKNKKNNITGVELQESVADMAKRSMLYNGLENNIHIINLDINNLENKFKHNSFDVVSVNPPYIKRNSGIPNQNDNKLISRHEITCTMEDVARVSSYLLKEKGRLYLIHRAERLVDIIYYLRLYRLEVKKLELLSAGDSNEFKLVLIKAIKSGGSGMKVVRRII